MWYVVKWYGCRAANDTIKPSSNAPPQFIPRNWRKRNKQNAWTEWCGISAQQISAKRRNNMGRWEKRERKRIVRKSWMEHEQVRASAAIDRKDKDTIAPTKESIKWIKRIHYPMDRLKLAQRHTSTTRRPTISTTTHEALNGIVIIDPKGKPTQRTIHSFEDSLTNILISLTCVVARTSQSSYIFAQSTYSPAQTWSETGMKNPQRPSATKHEGTDAYLRQLNVRPTLGSGSSAMPLERPSRATLRLPTWPEPQWFAESLVQDDALWIWWAD